MSRKKSLTKKIAHTLMAMSIVYSSGINIVVNEVYAAEKNITNNSNTGPFTETGAAGTGSSSGSVTDGENVELTGKITEATINDAIEVTATGGKGGDDDRDSPTTMLGAKGGDAVARVTVDESLSNIEVGNISVTSTAALMAALIRGQLRFPGLLRHMA